ncbi:hypothetical protein [Streptomyces litchfieldiae]|uniref:Transcriptional regulator n=1 Tax=Streptomyces litchfieldiae TaxID=3075543 RepID=A0ABU2MY93_9ACTN|nr:hypothetical protein [Streptomyces sp. DSM 44938]MDT0346332.1 hypothetical protein [Streptomyces sp. DSM 44938]
MRATLRVTLEGNLYLLGLGEPQRDLIREVLLFLRDRGDGDTASVVRAGVDRASLGRIEEKLAGGDIGLSIGEVHVLFSALTAAAVVIPSEQEFFTRIGFFKEQAVSLANALVRDIASAVDSR